jgi:beta-lactamase regulating signal transducer with metallopeptidase domain
MISQIVLESAVRVLLMGAAIFCVLGVLKIRQVRAQRAAWLLALLGALAMPLLVSQHWGPKLLPQWQKAATTFEAPQAAPSLRPLAAAHWTRTESLHPSAALTLPAPDRAVLTASVARDVYIFVSLTLTLRLIVGLVLAWRMRRVARPLSLAGFEQLDIRSSGEVHSPLTVASSVLLPPDYASWERSTLRVILSHEQSHVQRRDFWVQVLASVHCAVFWFSPFSWWLKRRLSNLGEALSDHAAVQHAQSRASYAELLLAMAQNIRGMRSAASFMGVAMARASNLEPRIDRLLSERDFERCFVQRRSAPLLAALVACVALVGATSMVRVAQAAHEIAPPAPPAAPEATVLPPPAPPPAMVRPAPPRPSRAPPAQPAAPPALPERDGLEEVSIKSGDVQFHFQWQIDDSKSVMLRDVRRRAEVAGEDYISYVKNDQTYVIRDGEILAKAKEWLAPLKELDEKQHLLEQQQKNLDGQLSHLEGRQAKVQVKLPDMSADYAAIESSLNQLKAIQAGKEIDADTLMQMQGHLATLQGRLAGLEGKLAGQEASLGGVQEGLSVEMQRLSEAQGRLGEQQGRLGEEQSQRADRALGRLRPLIEKAISDGSVKPVGESARALL